MDAQKILDKLRGEADRASTTLYLSKSIHEEFKKACGIIAPSRVIEELMKEFLESSQAYRSKVKKKAFKKN